MEALHADSFLLMSDSFAPNGCTYLKFQNIHPSQELPSFAARSTDVFAIRILKEVIKGV
jgi:hypothetical protein